MKPLLIRDLGMATDTGAREASTLGATHSAAMLGANDDPEAFGTVRSVEGARSAKATGGEACGAIDVQVSAVRLGPTIHCNLSERARSVSM